MIGVTNSDSLRSEIQSNLLDVLSEYQTHLISVIEEAQSLRIFNDMVFNLFY